MTADDEKVWRALKVLLSEGEFKLEGKAVPAFLSVYRWVDELPSKFQKALPEPKKPKLDISEPKKKRKKRGS